MSQMEQETDSVPIENSIFHFSFNKIIQEEIQKMSHFNYTTLKVVRLFFSRNAVWYTLSRFAL